LNTRIISCVDGAVDESSIEQRSASGIGLGSWYSYCDLFDRMELESTNKGEQEGRSFAFPIRASVDPLNQRAISIVLQLDDEVEFGWKDGRIVQG
jgi:hypothetical protein